MANNKIIERLEEIRQFVWDRDIPHPSIPEYEEYHNNIKEILEFIDYQINDLSNETSLIEENDNEDFLIIALIGASGSGKSTIEKRLTKEFKFNKIISTTNRPKRVNEVDGIDYYFVNTFEEDSMIESVKYNGYKYGISMENLRPGINVAVVEADGYRQIVEKYGYRRVIGFYIQTEMIVRYLRMINRGDSGEDAFKRILHDYTNFKDLPAELITIENNGSYPADLDSVINKILLNISIKG